MELPVSNLVEFREKYASSDGECFGENGDFAEKSFRWRCQCGDEIALSQAELDLVIEMHTSSQRTRASDGATDSLYRGSVCNGGTGSSGSKPITTFSCSTCSVVLLII